MKVLGVVVEYNPFHNGHLYHLKKAKELINPDFTVAVMSGNFVQRGEPAIIDKFSRAEIALEMGIDIVFELPFLYSIQDANGFAFGSIGLLDRTNVVTDVVFGSESADIKTLNIIAETLYKQPEDYQILLKKYLKKGYSFPNARKYALIDYFETKKLLDKDEILIIEKSNDILGLEYLIALKKLNSKIIPHTIRRKGSNYNDENFSGNFSSATAIRKLWKEKKYDLIKASVPSKTFEIIKREEQLGKAPIFIEDFEISFLSYLRTLSRDNLKKYYGVNEGLDQRIIEAAKHTNTIKELYHNIKSKRFTYTRIKRTLLNIYFGITNELIENINNTGPQYLRVLGFTEKGRELLSVMRNRVEYPIITTPSNYISIIKNIERDLKNKRKMWSIDKKTYFKMIEYDFKATNVYSLYYKNKEYSKYELDKKMKIIYRKGKV
ncbi:nucleotidyltransferase [Marinitoga aeolica]|uniref:tRNA(Met) cytidine acetate ligase n=1 Tax=Marinitoga aeolica TaxID=2809031 RepID=A0ABY8PPE4_9BACT|nr:nucleotidyltransferase [Marinitoga aeolica]WGS64505.1 nucleotidyltransferase [Marinitoga aeolica]